MKTSVLLLPHKEAVESFFSLTSHIQEAEGPQINQNNRLKINPTIDLTGSRLQDSPGGSKAVNPPQEEIGADE